MPHSSESAIQPPNDARHEPGEILRINEIFYSIQGESSYSGLPCVFVRLAECNLRCAYCDTEYAFHEWTEMSIPQVVARVEAYKCDLVEITGGEPLLQSGVIPLMRRLIESGSRVLLETGGSLDVAPVPSGVTIILDIKTPGSGMQEHNFWTNLGRLKPTDQVKFVICDREDYEWARDVIRNHRLEERCPVLISPVYGSDLAAVAKWMLQDRLKARFQIQLHKWIWGPDVKGV